MTLLPAPGGWGGNLAAVIREGHIVPSVLLGKRNQNVKRKSRESRREGRKKRDPVQIIKKSGGVVVLDVYSNSN